MRLFFQVLKQCPANAYLDFFPVLLTLKGRQAVLALEDGLWSLRWWGQKLTRWQSSHWEMESWVAQ